VEEAEEEEEEEEVEERARSTRARSSSRGLGSKSPRPRVNRSQTPYHSRQRPLVGSTRNTVRRQITFETPAPRSKTPIYAEWDEPAQKRPRLAPSSNVRSNKLSSERSLFTTSQMRKPPPIGSKRTRALLGDPIPQRFERLPQQDRIRHIAVTTEATSSQIRGDELSATVGSSYHALESQDPRTTSSQTQTQANAIQGSSSGVNPIGGSKPQPVLKNKGGRPPTSSLTINRPDALLLPIFLLVPHGDGEQLRNISELGVIRPQSANDIRDEVHRCLNRRISKESCFPSFFRTSKDRCYCCFTMTLKDAIWPPGKARKAACVKCQNNNRACFLFDSEHKRLVLLPLSSAQDDDWTKSTSWFRS